MSRYKKSQNQYYQNKMFRTDCKKVYSLLRQKNTNVKVHHPKKKQRTFGKKGSTQKEAYWIKNQCQQNSSMDWSAVSEMEVTEVLRMMLNWKASGRDQIANCWLLQLTEIHTYLATLFNKLIEVGQIPEWLMTGVTILIPKNENTERPKNYRPITCLPTIYKTITSSISKEIQKNTDVKNLMP